MNRPSRDRLTIAGLFLLALVCRLPGIGAGLPQVYEEAYPFKVAWTMWGWGTSHALDLNPHWFKYPGLTIYLQWLGQGLLYLVLSAAGTVRSTLDYRVLHQLDPTAFYLTGRAITALLGAATVVPVFLLARTVSGSAAGIAAAVLVAVNPALIVKSRVIEVDVPLTLMVAWGLLAAVRLGEGLTLRRALAAGAIAGLATSAKYPGALLAVPCLVAIVLGARAPFPPPARRGGGAARATSPRIAWPLACAACAAAWLAVVFVTSPFQFLDGRAALADLAVEREHMRLGHFGSDLGPAWLSYLGAWWGTIAGPPLALAAAAGMIVYLGPRRLGWALIVASFVLAYALLVSSFAMKADRYLLPLLPAAIVFACVLAAAECRRFSPPANDAARRGPRATALAGRARLAFAGATVVLALPTLAAIPAARGAMRPDLRTLARAWVEANLSPGALVVSEAYGPPLTSPLELQAIPRDLLLALQQRGWQPRLYAVISVPLFQVAPERSAAFYDPALYRAADAFIVTGSVRDRYRAEPARFAAQLALYDTLAASWEQWKTFPSGGPEPEITIYRQPGHAQVFAARLSPGPAPRLAAGAPSGGEAYFYYNVGLNHELFGFLAEALPAYLEGMRFEATDPSSATGCAERAAGALARTGRADDARTLLDQAASRAARPADASRLRDARARIAGP